MNDDTKTFEFAPLPSGAFVVNGPEPQEPQQAPKRRGRKPGSTNKRSAVKQIAKESRADKEPEVADRRRLVLQAIQLLSALDKPEARFVASLFA